MTIGFFKLRRIKDLNISKETFNIEVPKTIMKEENIYEGEFVTLKMKISSKMAYRVYDEFENFKKLQDGSFIAEIKYPKGQWIFSYISSFGEECEVLEPEEVRKEVKEKIKKMLFNYS